MNAESGLGEDTAPAECAEAFFSRLGGLYSIIPGTDTHFAHFVFESCDQSRVGTHVGTQ
jgi:hypothetical protein